MKKINSKKPLVLARETVRALATQQLERAAGGYDPSVRVSWCCPQTLFTCASADCSRACPQ